MTLEEKRARAREAQRRYCERHPDKIRENNRDYYHRDKPARAERRKAYYAVDPDKFRAANKEWRAANSKRVREYKREYRARLRAALNLPARAPNATIREALHSAPLYAAAFAAIPRGVPEHIRDDTISTIILAVLEGEIGEKDIASNAKRYLAAVYRELNYFKTVSIDAPIRGTEGLRLLDVIPAHYEQEEINVS